MKKYRSLLIGCFFSLWWLTASTKAANPVGALGLGGGFPELWHLSGRMSFTSAFQTGFRLFVYSSGDKDMRAVTFDMQFHFNKNVKEISDRSPWFFSLGVSFLVDDDETRRIEDTYFLMGLGWEQKLVEHVGWQIDGGLGARIDHDSDETKVFLDLSDKYAAVLPFLRIQFFSYF